MIFRVQLIFWPAHSRGGLVTFVATKVTKKAVSRKASLPHGALALQINQNHGLQNICSTSFTQGLRFANIAMPFPALKSPLFCLISPEAGLLTLIQYLRIKQKMCCGLTEKRAMRWRE
jgi:hypothetical protein